MSVFVSEMSANISDVDNTDQIDQLNSPTTEREPANVEESSSSDSSSSNDDECPRKKRRLDPKVTVDPRVDALFNQVSALTSLIMHQQCVPNNNSNGNVELPTCSESDFLINPSTNRKSLDLGICKTDFDDKKYIKPANEQRLKLLIDLQHFNSPTWQHVRYSKALNDMIAQPGFCNLKINDELCCLNKGKDYLAPTEQVVAALTNALLYQRELLQGGLQGIVDWAYNSPTELDPNNLFNKITETFGKASPSYKLSEQALQILCGKRAECIEIRRQRLISEIANKNIQAALCSIPPSEEFLFDKTKLTSLINSLGGSHFWLCQSQSKDKPNLKRKLKDTAPSTSRSNTLSKNKPNQDSYRKQFKKQDYKNKSNNSNKQSSFRNAAHKKL